MISVKKLIDMVCTEAMSPHTHRCLSCGSTFSADRGSCVSCSSPSVSPLPREREKDTFIEGKGAVVYNQQNADEVIPELLQSSATLKFLVINTESMSEGVNLLPYLGVDVYKCECGWHETEMNLSLRWNKDKVPVLSVCNICGTKARVFRGVDLVIIAQTHPKKADSWIKEIIKQCEETETPIFEIPQR